MVLCFFVGGNRTGRLDWGVEEVGGNFLSKKAGNWVTLSLAIYVLFGGLRKGFGVVAVV